VLVPAHNEESGIAATLAALLPQLAAGDRLLVVADNCSDAPPRPRARRARRSSSDRSDCAARATRSPSASTTCARRRHRRS
jgi:hypothetical protein